MGLTLALPFTDADLDGHNAIRVDPGGGTPVVVTVPLPSAVSLTGYYNRGVSRASDPTGYDDLWDRVIAAVEGAAAITWTTSHEKTSHVWRAKAEADSPPASPVIFYWAHASTTFDARWLGFPVATLNSASGDLEAPHQVGRLWRHDLPVKLTSISQRDAKQSRTKTGKVETRVYGGWTEWTLKMGALRRAQIFESAASDADFAAAISDLAAGDPNFALEALWRWVGSRTPLRLLEDEADTDASRELSLVGAEAIGDLRKALQQLADPRYFNFDIKALSYTP